MKKKEEKRKVIHKTANAHAIQFADNHLEVYPGATLEQVTLMAPKGFSLHYRFLAINMEIVHAY